MRSSHWLRSLSVISVTRGPGREMAAIRKNRKLQFDPSNSNNNLRQRFAVSSTPIKSDESESPPSSTGSCEKLLEITETSGCFKDLILNLEDLSEDVNELKQNFLEQNIQLGQYLANIDSKLDRRNRPAVREDEEEDDGVEKCNSFVFKKKSKRSFAEVPDEDSEEAASSSDDSEDSDYPDVMNISKSLNSMIDNVGQQDGSFMQDVETIEDKLEKFQRYLLTQKTEIARLELMKDALLMQNER